MTDDKPHTASDDEIRDIIGMCHYLSNRADVDGLTLHAMARELLARRERDAPPHKHGDDSYEESARHWHRLTVELRSRIDMLEGERERVVGAARQGDEMTEQERAVIDAARVFAEACANASKYERDFANARMRRQYEHEYVLHELALSIGPRTRELMQSILLEAVRALPNKVTP